MIEASVTRDEALGGYHDRIKIDGSLTVLTLELAHIVRIIYQHIGRENAKDAAAMRAALLEAMTRPGLDFWDLPIVSAPADQTGAMES